MRFACCAVGLLLVTSVVAWAAEEKKERPKPQAWTDAATAPKDFQIQGEYEFEGGGFKGGIQVLALGQEGFRAVFYDHGLPGAGWDGKGKAEISGKWDGDKVVFRKTGSDRFILEITEKGATGVTESGDKFAPKKVERKSPTLGAKPPAGAVVLFDGTSAEAWQKGRMDSRGLLMVGVDSKQKFKDSTMHVEFILPFMPDARGQGRSNSGVYPQHRYEVQVLDSFGLKGENNECGGVYQLAAPKVSMCFPPLAWQTYDIDLTSAKFDESGKKVANARITVRHNGVVIHDDLEIPKPSGGGIPETPEGGPLHFQDHGNPVFFRNVWVLEKK